MNNEPIKLVHVYYNANTEKVLVGRLALKERRLFFEYEPSFIERKLNLSPFMLPLKPGVIPSIDTQFEGMFGVFNDSLPDGWGRLLLDRKLLKKRINPGVLTPLDRLCFVGRHHMGALSYEPEIEEPHTQLRIELDKIADEIQAFQENDEDQYVEDLQELGGSSAGARPKILFSQADKNWIVKFRSSIDPKDIGNIEYAYHLMAVEAGLELPEAKLFPSKKGPGFFGVQRFDRNQTGPIHMHSLSGLLHADHRIPSLDYETIINATMHLTQDMDECEKQFRLCVFNVLAHNRDDHAKNFSFLMDNRGIWQTSPAYDLTFSSGPGGEHCSMVLGEGKTPSTSDLLQLASACNIKEKIAKETIRGVQIAIDKWPQFADQAEVGKASKKMIEQAIKSCG